VAEPLTKLGAGHGNAYDLSSAHHRPPALSRDAPPA